MPNPRAPEREADEPMAMTWTVGRVAAVVVVIVMVGFWAWIFAGGPKRLNADRLDDREFVERSEQRCLRLRDRLAKLPNAAEVRSAERRADVLDRATDEVESLVRDLRADAPRTGDDAKSLRGWFADWDRYVRDRRDYADRLREDPKARFYVTENEELKDSVDKTIEVFTQVNDMRDCATPGDVG